MAKILVKSPITSNGRDVVLDAQGKIRYKETIVEAAAQKTFEKINRTLPPARKYIIEPYTGGDGSVTAPSISGKPDTKIKPGKNDTNS